MEIRSATIDDLDAVVDIASIVDPPADDAELDVSYYRHLLGHGDVVVAEASDIVIGYAAAIDVGDTRHVSDLFLHQDARGQDIGRRLLDAVWDHGRGVRAAPDVLVAAPGRAAPLHSRRDDSDVAAALPERSPQRPCHAATWRCGRSTVRSGRRQEAEWLGWDRSAEYGYWAATPRCPHLCRP